MTTIELPQSAPCLWDLPHPPKRWYTEGNLSLLKEIPQRGLGVIGTRSPLPISEQVVHRTLQSLKGRSLVVISGIASGIDTAAHRAALEHGLPTIAVLGTPLEKISPTSNRPLAEAIVRAGGLLVSEFPRDRKTYPSDFLHRNRTIAAWSSALWVVQAPHRSGSLNTAAWVRKLQRKVDLYATPSFPGNRDFAGNQALLQRDGAIPLWDASDLGRTWLELATLNLSNEKKSPEQKSLFPLQGDELLLWDQIQYLSSLGKSPTPQDLLEWAMERGWTPGKFFKTLREVDLQGNLPT